MTANTHGVSLGIERQGMDHFFVVLKLVGTLRHSDYEYMVPILEDAIAGVKQPVMQLLVDASEFEGWEARAAWDDVKFGLKHAREFEKMALVGRPGWQEWLTRFADWFTPADARFFMDKGDALDWLGEGRQPSKADSN